MVRSEALRSALPRFAPPSLAPVKCAPVSLAPFRFAEIKFAPITHQVRAEQECFYQVRTAQIRSGEVRAAPCVEIWLPPMCFLMPRIPLGHALLQSLDVFFVCHGNPRSQSAVRDCLQSAWELVKIGGAQHWHGERTYGEYLREALPVNRD
jgi:hypothetical protein